MNRVAKSLIAAATLLPAVAVPTAGAAAVLTFSPLPGAAQILGGNPLLPPDLFPDNMVDALGGYVCRNPDNSCTSVIYSPLSIQQGVDMLNGALPGALAVDPPYINPAGDGKVIVFAYSQGGQVVQQWMKQNAVPNGGAAPGVDPDDVSFFLYANSTRKYGGSLAYGWANLLGQEVMPETAYDVTDISRQYDYATDFPDDPFNSLAVMNAIMGAVFIHGDYIFLNPDDPANAVWTEHNSLGGSIKYILVPTTNLPLLEPLRRIGLTALADSLNEPLKAFIELAYKRPAPFPVVSDPANARIASAENTLQLSLATGGEAAAEQTPESNGTELSGGSNDPEPIQGSENLELTEGSENLELTEGSADLELTEGSADLELTEGSADLELTEGSADLQLTNDTGEDQTVVDTETTPPSGGADVQDPATTKSPPAAQPEQENGAAPRHAATSWRKPTITAAPGQVGGRHAKKTDSDQAPATGERAQAPDGDGKPAAANSEGEKGNDGTNGEKGADSDG